MKNNLISGFGAFLCISLLAYFNSYDESNLLNWEIKCVREPEDEAIFIGVFMYRNGTAYDYESVKGICYFHNNIDRKELPSITSFLQGKFNGKEMEKGDRIILKGSDEIYSATDISNLAKEMRAAEHGAS